ncbi:beta-lactamase family protein (plasmid) [Qingshengfaniella alkalisoli]|uniref:Beta-lactamase family protein n=2 Tax=Qingshengfaniella alkalisoli TaxID=2599296 RepID=A0A5B8J0I7_9RHOB|nr:beta-lactamase family protein [Qingshengfaniella alkalisoli]
MLDNIAAEGLEVHSLLVWHDGVLIQDAYWDPYGPERLHMMHSVTKSFTAMAVGLAWDDGLLDLDLPVIGFFPEHRAVAPEGIEAMTLRHLLTMTSGHGRGISGGAWRKLKTSWVADFLRQPLDHTPGSVFVYDSACSYVLSAIVQKVTGRTCHAYLRDRVFDPIGLSPAIRWDLSPEGINSGGNGLWCRSSDLLSLGILHLQEGRWQGRQILSRDWVRAATGMQVRDVSLGVLTGEAYLGPGESHEGAEAERREGYGFQWWRGPRNSYSANGLFGQNCFVFPNERAVVAVTAGMDDEDTRLKRMIHDDLRPALGQWRGAELAPRLAELDLACPPPGNISVAPAGWQGLYLARQNEQDIACLRLEIVGDAIRLVVEDRRGRHEVLAGLGHRCEGMTTMTGARLHHAYEADPPGFRVAAWAAWSASDAEGWSCLTLDWAFVETAFRDTLRIRLRGGELRLQREVNVNSSIRSLPELRADQVAEDCREPEEIAP